VAIRYADDRVFVGLRDGKLVIYDRDDSKSERNPLKTFDVLVIVARMQ
jgi:hypothetical protein